MERSAIRDESSPRISRRSALLHPGYGKSLTGTIADERKTMINGGEPPDDSPRR
jgi:hypothetical protein